MGWVAPGPSELGYHVVDGYNNRRQLSSCFHGDAMTFVNDGQKQNDSNQAASLERFLAAQDESYLEALDEIRNGRKRTHWMWYVFPQFAGLGMSSTSQYYAIQSRDEARAYLSHPVLGARLLECMETLLQLDGRSAHAIFGSPDDMKLRSCATLFASISAPGSLFHQLLDKYFQGTHDRRTLELMGHGD